MIRVSIRIRDGAAHLNVAVQAESIQRALSIVHSRHPTANVEVEFPISPEGFFVEGPLAPEELIETGKSRKQAA